ncbi:MAG: NTP transferase domain-containing protein [Sphingomonas bacterium]|nr:NTP transferase domain-containing protein [Sphingomonas bacterium]
MKWTALLLAGSRPGGDPFAEVHGAKAKALILVAGTPMISRPARALLDDERIDRVRVLAQDGALLAAALPDDPRLTIERSGATIAATIEAIIADPATRWPLLVTTADHALLDGAMIDDFCARAEGADVAIGLVEQRALMARLPQTKRTWIGFRGGSYSGANLFALGSPKAARAVRLWREVEQDRKKGWKLLVALGLPGLLGLARLRTLEQVLDAMGQRLGLSIRAVELANPLAAVDVDKSADLTLVEAIIAGRA